MLQLWGGGLVDLEQIGGQRGIADRLKKVGKSEESVSASASFADIRNITGPYGADTRR